MRTAIVLMMVLVSGCVTAPPQEALVMRTTGDQEVAKLRMLAEINVNKRFDTSSARVWALWRETVDKAKALDPSGKGMVPAEFLEKSIELRDDKLMRIENSRRTALQQAADLQENYLVSSGSIYDAWASQGKVTGETVQMFREAAMQGVQAYGEYRQARSLAKEAKRAAEAAKAEAEEGGE